MVTARTKTASKTSRRWTIYLGSNDFTGCAAPHDYLRICPDCHGGMREHRIDVEAESSAAAMVAALVKVSRDLPTGAEVVSVDVEAVEGVTDSRPKVWRSTGRRLPR
jgi:hypothetical protein